VVPSQSADYSSYIAPAFVCFSIAVLVVGAFAGRTLSRSVASPDAKSGVKRVPLRAFESELGVQAPVGFWDPLGLSKDGDAVNFKRRRETEIKHGRVAMLATMGYITPELVGKFPGYISPTLGVKFADIDNGLQALSQIPGPGWLQIVAYCLYCEAGPFGYNADPNRKPGDCGWKPIGLWSNDAQVRTRRLNAELANGRLAMMAIIGMFFQDGLTGSAWGDWASYTASPLR
jgi:hypothetical protein